MGCDMVVWGVEGKARLQIVNLKNLSDLRDHL